VQTDELDYELPDDAIAQTPCEPRDAARLLVDGGADRPVEHRRVRDLPDLLAPGDLVVVNDTRVLPARLHLHKDSGGAVELLFLEPEGRGSDTWIALVRPGRRVPPGTVVRGPEGTPAVEVGGERGDGRRAVRVLDDDVVATLGRYGEVPLPPYISAPLGDAERYQTVFADRARSTAAPTAGLHLTSTVLDELRARGIDVATVELAIGLDTFRPIQSERVEDHPMHTERYHVPETTWKAVQDAARVVAVGTTVVRTLESAAATGELEGRTDLFIRRSYDFAVVDALLTNFHMPRTTLLALIDAFVGPRWRELYRTALTAGYRFLSFGDAMFLPSRSRSAPR
jgi:S-adenosylmethionine:tRNA ribosyltransferase-isomerase